MEDYRSIGLVILSKFVEYKEDKNNLIFLYPSIDNL